MRIKRNQQARGTHFWRDLCDPTTRTTMPRRTILEPTKIPSRCAQGKSAWCINVPAELSETGKRQQLFFQTEKLAKVQCAAFKARAKTFGNSLTLLTPAHIAEAAEAYHLLEDMNASLLTVVHGFIHAYKVRTASVTFPALFDQFLDTKADRNHMSICESSASHGTGFQIFTNDL